MSKLRGEALFRCPPQRRNNRAAGCVLITTSSSLRQIDLHFSAVGKAVAQVQVKETLIRHWRLFVVLEPGVQGLEVEFVVDQVFQCKGKAAWDDLLRQDTRQ